MASLHAWSSGGWGKPWKLWSTKQIQVFINFVEMNFPLWLLSPKLVLLPRADCSLVFDCDFDIAKCEIVSGLPTPPSHPGDQLSIIMARTQSLVSLEWPLQPVSVTWVQHPYFYVVCVCVSSSSAQIMIWGSTTCRLKLYTINWFFPNGWNLSPMICFLNFALNLFTGLHSTCSLFFSFFSFKMLMSYSKHLPSKSP